MKLSSTIGIAAILQAPLALAWLPVPGMPKLFTQDQQKIRGVNLGSLFVFEPFYAYNDWNNVVGCPNTTRSENDCVKYLKTQAIANTNFNNHWHDWVNHSDITQMVQYGLNTIRIPVGFWMIESLVRPDLGETFPQQGLAYLKQICGWAADAGMFIIMDLHGAPGAQVSNNPDTGYYVNPPNFPDNTTNYNRAYTFIDTFTNLIQNDTSGPFRTVGMLEILNEPIENADSSHGILSTYYPTAIQRIRTVESNLKVPASRKLHAIVMDENWGAGDPVPYVSSSSLAPVGYDHHEYPANNRNLPAKKPGYPTQAEILNFTCGVNVSSDHDAPKVVGEFGITVSINVTNDDDFKPNSQNAAFYARYFAAIQQTAERNSLGWVSWTWKSGQGYRSSYIDAVVAGVIPRNLTVSATNSSVCPAPR